MNTIVEQKELFAAVQVSGIFQDSKTFPDLTAIISTDEIAKEYEKQKVSESFNLKVFVSKYFRNDLPNEEVFITQNTASPEKHIEGLWSHLTKKTGPQNQNSTYIALPHPFVVPGGRFQELYYWDSYFTMLGLIKSKKHELVVGMIENFAYLIEKFGFIPNGNRTYFLSRSQPPFFSLMVDLLDQIESRKKPQDFVLHLEKEYEFWCMQRSITMPDGETLSQYNDNDPTPRAESYIEDIELAQKSTQNPESLYRNIRAACESGWDFSSRWLGDNNKLETIKTTEILPVDLNCLLFQLETRLSELHPTKKTAYKNNAERRKLAIQKYFWNEELGFFCDFDLSNNTFRKNLTLAGVFPLYFKLANAEQASKVAHILETSFLKEGGLLTTTNNSGQQWDAPNGWAPLQWMSYIGLKNYGFLDLAKKIKHNWMIRNSDIFLRKGKFTEKYNVEGSDNETGGGEYPNQDGFGWTNGVYLSFKYES